MVRLRPRPRFVEEESSWSPYELQKRAPVQSGSQIQLTRGFNAGQLVYTAPVTVEGQTMQVQIDTSTSDLWFASDRCNSIACRSKQAYEIYLFSDNSGLETGQNFQIDYLVGSASGPIIISNVTFANTSIINQAFASANAVISLDLGHANASGVMGLGLPAGSIVQTTLSGGDLLNAESNSNETGSVLPGLWTGTPSVSRFFGLGLQRLPSDGGNGNSTLTFGDFDKSYLPPSQQVNIQYSNVLPDSDNIIRHWKLAVNDFTVYVNGSRRSIPLSSTGVAGPTAVIDSASPLNLAGVNFLNALYGAVNVGPAADGSGGYYLDCGLAFNLTVTIGGIPIPLHPLDSNLKQDSTGTGNGGCIGSFQSISGDNAGNFYGSQIILGAPFLRSVYSIYSCQSTNPNATAAALEACNNPRLGFHALYNTSASYNIAMADFNKVRVQGLQLGDNSIVGGTAASNVTKGRFGTSAKIAVGVVVGLVGVLIAMAALLFVLKRRKSRLLPEESSVMMDDSDQKGSGASTAADLTEKERQKQRELALLYGQFVEDADGQSSAMSSHTKPTFGSDSQTGDWDVSSKGYWEARAIKNEYQKKMRQQQNRGSSSTRNSVIDQEADEPESHELVDLSPKRHLED